MCALRSAHNPAASELIFFYSHASFDLQITYYILILETSCPTFKNEEKKAWCFIAGEVKTISFILDK